MWKLLDLNIGPQSCRFPPVEVTPAGFKQTCCYRAPGGDEVKKPKKQPQPGVVQKPNLNLNLNPWEVPEVTSHL